MANDAPAHAFLREHLRLWPWVLPALFLVTLGHELAHAAAARLCGATVLEIVVWPTDAGSWGYVQYHLPRARAWADPLVALAPSLLWLAVAAGTHVRLCRAPGGGDMARRRFLWGFALPVGDVFYALFPFLAGRPNDLVAAFGALDAPRALFGSLALGALAAWTYHVHALVYGRDALAPRPFLVALVLFLLAIWSERFVP